MQELTAEDPREISGYELKGRLGAGGMGVVYLSHTRGGQPVALKVVRREYAENPEFRRRFAREVQAARRVHGTYTTPVVDSDTEAAQPWLASAYVPGPALADAVTEHGPLAPPVALSLVAGIAEALASIHGVGVVHRDLKPSNVLLAADGPRVIDFGIARAADTTALTGTDVRLGTPAYMAPEQVTGAALAGPEIDVFALGMVAHFAATGGHAFGEGDGHAILYRIVAQEPEPGDCPPELLPIVTACLAKDPAERPTPAQVIELCRAGGMSFAREAGWWLPATAAGGAGAGAPPAPAAERPVPSATPAPDPRADAWPAPGRPGPLRPVTDAPPPAEAVAPVPVGAVPAGPHPHTAVPTPAVPSGAAHDGPPRRRQSVVLIAAVLAALLIGAGATYLVTRNGDDKQADAGTGGGESGGKGSGGDGSDKGGSGGSGNLKLAESDKRMVIRPPAERGEAFSACSGADSVLVDLDTLAMATTNHGSYQADGKHLEYMNCGKDGTAENSGLHLVDNMGLMGRTTERNIGAADCRDTARESTLPNPVTIAQIQDDSVLKKDTGICFETAEKSVVLMWIDRIDKSPDNHDLSSYVVTATRWKPAAS
ncbi:Serine/threonine-protein kinase AfsK [Streptomyces sp. YIM 130001]|uniref:serine/threonine-protein kinase n=1 Tax=Streptomyces sp. YIM 130001 TaxID=2259644 RepID=UPI000ED11ABB|nr:serine/threonine-protein kinase [Streptomyces sp. YIM 130001]RII15847.1 Serine/threonine-protein kinase AfsK [Streptomyces sp. YIM 130001]